MQIVINLEDEIYEDIKYRYDKNQLTLGAMVLELAILHGEILPKGHGRLVDENHVIAELVYRKNLLADNVKCGEVTKIFDSAVVVEADKENDNGADN